MFVDKVKIIIYSGNGGNGCISFHKELYKPYGGPDGGDGGDGGDVIIKLDKNLNSLAHYKKKVYSAENGYNGYKNKCHGAKGKNIILKVPSGTVVINAVSKKIITDITYNNKKQVLLKGGKGGKGNIHYATSVIQFPKYAQLGQRSNKITIILELKLIVDIGIIGFANIGKSTLLTKISNAKPKISNYCFTTIEPYLGVVNLKKCKKFTIVEIPGLLCNTNNNIKFGKKFLKHIERANMLLHLVDVSKNINIKIINDIYRINRELINYNINFMKYYQIIVINKTNKKYNDYENLIYNIRRIFYYYKIKVFVISTIDGSGINKLFYYINNFFNKINKNNFIKKNKY